jgi:hypothetical protein
MKGGPLSSSWATGWPPKSFSAKPCAGVGRRSTSADPVIEDNVTAANAAGKKHDDSSGVRPIGGTSRVLRAGWITATVNGFTGNGWFCDKNA